MDRDHIDGVWEGVDPGSSAAPALSQPRPMTGLVGSRSRRVDRVADWYVTLVTASFVLTIVLCLAGYAAGLSDRAMFAIAALPAIACAHPGVMAAVLADLIVGWRYDTIAQTGTSWNLVFCAAVAPFIVALILVAWRKLTTGGWKACVPAYCLACAYTIAVVWVCKTVVVVGGSLKF